MDWLRNCRDCHGNECAGMKLIDSWVTLSYLWGKQEEVAFDDHPAVTSLYTPSPPPRLISDAITVAKNLGYRYLWVDKYCIDQQNEPEKIDHINNMDLIYIGAEVTIMAASGINEAQGLPGIGSTKRSKQQVVELPSFTLLSTGPDPTDNIEESKWWTRGWTFQDAFLSLRKLVLTEYRTYFKCITIS
ncbi:heterokaryon incompatibility protein-domain-containing protein [Thelonectria olida]|uniref:Heterokaryon incompatibility protein-domain-containing protein n=1 Tax=Thelonectria olida TaxID=1576542 RepID=A0A9P8WEF9_9HYPO|nr:heterokaryon incompatibility protein-domain-containing protein [Thelonectria olida]